MFQVKDPTLLVGKDDISQFTEQEWRINRDFRHPKIFKSKTLLIIARLFSSMERLSIFNYLPLMSLVLLRSNHVAFKRKLPQNFQKIFLIFCLLNLRGLWPIVFPMTTQSWVFYFTVVIFVAGTATVANAQKTELLAHIVPKGRPLTLAPLLVLIETLSYLIRPLTLRLRIIANLAVGHVICSLMRCAVISFGNSLVPLLVGLTLFEIAVRIIQAYIFSLLFMMYLENFIFSIIKIICYC